MNRKPRIFLSAAFVASMLVPGALGQTGQPLAKEAVLTSLSTKLDSKKTKVGDAVAAKTLNPLTLNDGSVVPSGSRILGKVTQVQSKSSGTATIAIEFDRREKKGAAATPVHGLIAGIAPLPDLGSGGGAAANDIPGRGNAAQNAAMTGMSTGSGSGTEAPIPAGSSIKGVTLSSTPAADGSVAIQSTEKDFKLESGTRMEIGLTTPQ
jgi:hypothetical protein